MSETVTTTDRAPSADTPGPRGTDGPSKRESVWRVVAAREMSVKARDRGFLISTLATLAFILGAVGLQMYFASSGEKVSVAVAGSQGGDVLKRATALAEAAGEDVDFTAKPVASADAAEDAVLAGKADVGLVPAGDGWTLLGKTDRDSAAATWIGTAVQQSALERNAAEAGTSIAELARGGSLEYRLLAPDDTPQMVVRIATYVFGFLFYLAAVLLGVSLATSVVEEKQNRIVEIIASSIRLRDLLIGKIVGNTMMALAQLLVFSAAGVIALVAMDKADALRQITTGLGWFLVFCAVGIALLACVFAAAGALASRTEDIQSTTTPVSIVVAVIFVAGVSASGTFQTVLSFLPLASAITMPGRVVAGDAAWWEAAASLLCSLVAAVFVVLVSERIYRRALMQTGGKLSVRQALKLQD